MWALYQEGLVRRQGNCNPKVHRREQETQVLKSRLRECFHRYELERRQAVSEVSRQGV